MSTEKFKQSDIIPADPREKVSFFKKIEMTLWAKKNRFALFRTKNRYWKYYATFIEDVFNFSLCGLLIALPIYHPGVITLALGFGSALWIYSNKIHGLVLQLLATFGIVRTGDKK